MQDLIYNPVTKMRDAFVMRKIRNDCREFMTRNQGYISHVAQARWYRNVYKPAFLYEDMLAYLFYLGKKPVGYGLIRDASTFPVISGGLIASERGKGYGKKLFRILTDICLTMQGRVWLEVLISNEAARHLYEDLGYKEVKRDEKSITMQIV